MILSSATREDTAAIFALYQAVAAIEGGLARTAEEISEEYIAHFLSKSLESGFCLVARESLEELRQPERVAQIKEEQARREKWQRSQPEGNQSLSRVFAEDEVGDVGCLICHL